MGESMSYVNKTCRELKKTKVRDKMQILRRTDTELGGADWLHPRTTFDVLPHNVLLDTFEFYLGKYDADVFDHAHNYDGWQTLVHVCLKWQCLVFASPHRLGLKLYCTPRRSVHSKMLDIWPALPIVMYAPNVESKEDVTDVIAALRQHNRVCKICFHNWRSQDPLLKGSRQ